MRIFSYLFFIFLLSSLSVSSFSSSISSENIDPASGVTLKQFMPDNDLWMEDSYYKNFQPNVDRIMFDKIIQAGRDAYASNAPTINGNWDDATVNASCMKMFGMVTVNMYGGLARRPEITPEGFALVLCHELGHAYGGIPYIRSTPLFEMSAEGQSDYYGTLSCYDRIAARVSELSKIVDTSDLIRIKCEQYQNDQTKYANCLGKMEGGLSLGLLLSRLKNEPAPQYETPDPTVVSATELSYPATIQCRLDSYFAGTLSLPRPACWFKQ